MNKNFPIKQQVLAGQGYKSISIRLMSS